MKGGIAGEGRVISVSEEEEMQFDYIRRDMSICQCIHYSVVNIFFSFFMDEIA